MILDPTYGKGVWWSQWRPTHLYVPPKGTDFRDLGGYDDSVFDAAVFDPPYVAMGGRSTSTIPDFLAAYGMREAPRTPQGVQAQVNGGLRELHRVVRPQGKVLVKCQDYVSSGQLWLGTHWTLTHALSLGYTVVDRLEHVGHARPQPPGRQQVHARRNLSTLFVLQTGEE